MFEDIEPEVDWEEKYKKLEEILKENSEVIRNLQEEISATDTKLMKYSRYTDICQRFSKRIEKELGTEKYDKICDEILDEYKKDVTFNLGDDDD